MLTKICLVVAILASAGTLALTFLKVEPEMVNLAAKVEAAKQETIAVTSEKQKLAGELSKAKNDLGETTKKLTAATKDAADANAKADAAEAATDKANKAVAAAKAETEKVKEDNKQYFELGMTPAQIKTTVKERDTLKSNLAAVTAENKATAAKNKLIAAELDSFKNLFPKPPAMPGVKGSVVSVDPKWDFVVVNVGSEKGALENGELRVSRGGQLIGKLKLVRVEKTYSVANVMKAFKTGKDEITEGDEAIY